MIARIAPLGKTLIKDGKEVVARYFDIRKLAPQECLRLMGVRENDVQKIMECGISNSAVYKCAGNSIVEDVLYHIFRKLLVNPGNESSQLSLFADETSEPLKHIRLFEAFAGYGSQAMALKRLCNDSDVTMEHIGISEIDPAPIQAYMAVHGDVKNYGDIGKIWWDNVPDFDLFTYSFPCTDISSAGKQMGLSEGSGSRSSLLWECRNAIKIKRPKYCLMENVKALTQDKFIGEFQKWQIEMESMGYANFTQVLNAKDYGVAQNRERVFMLSILKTPEDPEPQYHFPQGFKLTKSIRDYLDEDFDPRLLLKPENVIKFLKDNNNDDSIYVVTDRKFTDEELDEIRHSAQSEDRGGKGD